MAVSPISPAIDPKDPLAILTSASSFFISAISDLPRANLIGMVVGTLTFLATICTVIYLLVAGGSFSRIAAQQAEQKASNGAPQPTSLSYKALASRPALLDDLSLSRSRMLASPAPPLSSKLLLPAPPEALYKLFYREHMSHSHAASSSVPGNPTSVLTAYARAASTYAGAFPGSPTATLRDAARRYARVYASVCTASVKENDKWAAFASDPVGSASLVGSLVNLFAVTPPTLPAAASRLASFARCTDGRPIEGESEYDPTSVWCLALSPGPVDEAAAADHPLFSGTSPSSATLLVSSNTTLKTVGVIVLGRDDPASLSVDVPDVVFHPGYAGTLQEAEALYLVLQRIFALGYRRVTRSVDAGDVAGKRLLERAGFSLEGTAAKARLKELEGGDVVSCNLDCYAMLNSDWKKRWEGMYAAVYGAGALAEEKRATARDTEEDEKKDKLREMREEELKKEKGFEVVEGEGKKTK